MNDLVFECQITCAEPDCEASFKGRVVLRARFATLGSLFGGGDGVSLKGYMKDDVPSGWAIRQPKPSGYPVSTVEAMYCPLHGTA